MFFNFIWATLNSSAGIIISLMATMIISRNMLPKEFLDLSTLSLLSSLGNIFIDLGSSQKCYLKKNISNRSFLRIEKFMLSRVLITTSVIFVFCLISQYLTTYNPLLILIFLLDGFIFYFIFRPNYLFNKLKLFKLKTKLSILSSLLASSISIILTFIYDGKIGFITLLILNPLILCFLLRKNLDLNPPSLYVEFNLKLKDFLKG
jgi:hypothetical protein